MRGTVIGEQVQSQAATPEYRENHDRTFGPPDGSAKGGKWVMTPNGLVPASEYVPPHENHTLMVVTDRYMEGHQATDGTDIGSRQKRRAYMRENGLADYDDFSPAFRERVKKDFERQQDRERHEALKRAVYEHKEKARRR